MEEAASRCNAFHVFPAQSRDFYFYYYFFVQRLGQLGDFVPVFGWMTCRRGGAIVARARCLGGAHWASSAAQPCRTTGLSARDPFLVGPLGPRI